MKLTNIVEGTFGDMVSLAAAKIGSKPEDRIIVKADQQLFGLAQQAKKLRYHLFDQRAIPWWKKVFGYFKIPENMFNDVWAAAKSEYYDRIDRSLFEADISKIADILNPRTRAGTVKAAARAATNERLAIAIIGYVSRAAGNLPRRSPNQKKQASQKKQANQKRQAPKGKKPPAKPKTAIVPTRSKVKRWKKLPDDATLERAMKLAKAALRSSGKVRQANLKQLDNDGFRIDWDVDPPKLTLKR